MQRPVTCAPSSAPSSACSCPSPGIPGGGPASSATSGSCWSNRTPAATQATSQSPHRVRHIPAHLEAFPAGEKALALRCRLRAADGAGLGHLHRHSLHVDFHSGNVDAHLLGLLDHEGLGEVPRGQAGVDERQELLLDAGGIERLSIRGHVGHVHLDSPGFPGPSVVAVQDPNPARFRDPLELGILFRRGGEPLQLMSVLRAAAPSAPLTVGTFPQLWQVMGPLRSPGGRGLMLISNPVSLPQWLHGLGPNAMLPVAKR